jgi:hypothetical protein
VQVVKTAIGQMSEPDQAFVKRAFEDMYGSRERSRLGPLGEEITRSANYIQGISKLMNAAVLQPVQAGVGAAHLVGRLGPTGGLRSIVNATKQFTEKLGTSLEDAKQRRDVGGRHERVDERFPGQVQPPSAS